jgi:thioredoxin-like negative regulator of GroEL
MPTFQFYKNGQKVDELRGANPAALEELIKKNSE